MKKDIPKERIEPALRLRKVREEAGYSQEKFSEVLDISASAYKKIENGTNPISLACLKKLYHELGVSTDYIIFGEREELDEIWRQILCIDEADKMMLFLRLLDYFAKKKDGLFPLDETREKMLRSFLKQ